MKKLTYILLLSAAFLFVGQTSKAQDYNPNYTYAAGLKFGGYENGVAGKWFMDKTTSLEAFVGLRSPHGLVITGLYELNTQIADIQGFRFYYGAGAHIGAVGAGYYKRFNGDNQLYTSNHILLGIDGIIGLEYVIPQTPIAVSLDLNPRVEIATGPFVDVAPGLGIKYCFK